ncbi:unnamed protein product [Blepharisma stoltei]|uniref:Uncharacterized protein n=1 Tax=Blepharisma stoltei TaxID=1481888 RepID=A0AAU9IHK7_9CILI|nr:unnamed protein product [Blepharisma stoltei]
MRTTQKELLSSTSQPKGSTGLYAALQKERTATKSLLTSVGKQVIGKSKKAVTEFRENQDMKEALIGEVRGLSNYRPPEKNERIETMIQKQKESRRLRHLNLLKEFEGWIEALYDNLAHSGEDMIFKWEQFAKASQDDLDKMLDGLSDDVLLSKELEWLKAAFDNYDNHLKKRREEAETLRSGLFKLEKDRQTSVDSFVNLLKDQLIEIAFMLAPEVEVLVGEKRSFVMQTVEEREKHIIGLMEKLWAGEEILRETYKERIEAKEEMWRTVHHDYTLQQFKITMTSSRFVNPEERINMFKDLKGKQVEIFQKRLEWLTRLGNICAEELTQEKVEGFIDKISKLNNNAQLIYDEKISKIVNLQSKIDSEADDLLEITKNKLEFYAAKISYESLDKLVDTECQVLVDARKNESKKLLTKSIKYLEDTDVRANDICNVLGNFWKGMAVIYDEQRKKQIEEEKKYELELATRGDQNDENLDTLEERFKENVDKLTKTVTPEELEEKLKTCFAILDDIGTEYRSYTENVVNVINNHGNIIANCYGVFFQRLGEKFGMMPLEKKNDYFEQIRQAKLKEYEEEKQKLIEEGKKKAGGKKEEEPKFEMPVLEEWEYSETKWFYVRNVKNIMEEMLITDEDREQERIRLQKEEEARKREEERKIAEEIAKKEEARNRGKKPDPKKAEEKKVEIVQPSPEIVEIVEDPVPIDPEGNPCLETNVFITYEILSSEILKLREKSIDYVKSEKAQKIATASKLDKKLKEACVNELDEKLRYLWPRKGKLEVNEYTARSSEIRGHHKRYDRYLEEFKKKKDSNVAEFQSLLDEANNMLVSYKVSQDQLRAQLPSGTSLAELQGLLNRAKDNDLSVYQKGRKIIARLDELNNIEISSFSQQNEKFISGLQLIEQGGQYSVPEVEFYRSKTNALDQELGELQGKRRDVIEALKKKLEIERVEPIKAFEKEYAISMENLSAREGIGKKYRAPKRNAQEKITGEMTKCERAQGGIDNTIVDLERLVEEYKDIIAAKAEPRFSTRTPSLAIEIRRTLISLRACMQKYGSHISAFKEEAGIQALKPMTWREDLPNLNPAPEEILQEASRLELLLSPLFEIGVSKQPTNFWQKILDIEKIAREETLKLYPGKGAQVPDFMEKYLRKMKSSVEDFRLKRIKALRESAERVTELESILAECTINSLELGMEFVFEQDIERIESTLMVNYENDEKLKEKHQKLLRPNLSNPSCRAELEEINKNEEERCGRAKKLIKDAYDNFLKSVRKNADEFKIKLLNNTEALLFLYDNLLIKQDFIMLPGDEQEEPKRSNIKRLARKKKSAKPGEVVGPRGYKKTWPGLQLNVLKLPEEPNISDSAPIQSYKHIGHKSLIKIRNEAFRVFSLLFETKLREYVHKFTEMLTEEDKWEDKWKISVHFLRTKNT